VRVVAVDRIRDGHGRLLGPACQAPFHDRAGSAQVAAGFDHCVADRVTHPRPEIEVRRQGLGRFSDPAKSALDRSVADETDVVSTLPQRERRCHEGL
jgi:hypothetical protein